MVSGTHQHLDACQGMVICHIFRGEDVGFFQFLKALHYWQALIPPRSRVAQIAGLPRDLNHPRKISFWSVTTASSPLIWPRKRNKRTKKRKKRPRKVTWHPKRGIWDLESGKREIGGRFRKSHSFSLSLPFALFIYSYFCLSISLEPDFQVPIFCQSRVSFETEVSQQWSGQSIC